MKVGEKTVMVGTSKPLTLHTKIFLLQTKQKNIFMFDFEQ